MPKALREFRSGGRLADRRPTLVAGFLSLAMALPLAATGSSVELRLQQKNGQPLAGAVLTATSQQAQGRGANSVVMDQREQRFLPHILPVQTRTPVQFANADNVSHHVYSFSKPKRFEIYLPKNSAAETIEFDQPGVVAVGCNIHDWMLAYVYVVETPYFTQTDERGQATLDNLPAGSYQLQVWHPRIADKPHTLTLDTVIEFGAGFSWDLRLDKPVLPARNQEPGFVDY